MKTVSDQQKLKEFISLTINDQKKVLQRSKMI